MYKLSNILRIIKSIERKVYYVTFLRTLFSIIFHKLMLHALTGRKGWSGKSKRLISR